MLTSGCCWGSCSVCRVSAWRRSRRLPSNLPHFIADGCASLQIAVVSPFVDRRHGTERAVAELIERLAGTYSCEVHLFAQQVADLSLTPADSSGQTSRGSVLWHRVPSIPGP